jgi:hypothetical protein
MKPANNAIAFWQSHERRARVYGSALIGMSFMNVMAQVNLYREAHKEREVVRIGCDGIPQLVRLNDEVYAEPDLREIRAFAAEFTVFFMRGDSYSAVNDAAWCARRMTPELGEAYRNAMRGTREKPGAITILEALKRRTQIDPSGLEISVDKKSYPWRANVKGARQIVGADEATAQPFELDLELFRASRNDVVEGLVVSAVHPRGEVAATPVTELEERTP